MDTKTRKRKVGEKQGIHMVSKAYFLLSHLFYFYLFIYLFLKATFCAGIENVLVDTAGEGEGGMNWESGIDISTYIEICLLAKNVKSIF